MKPRMVLEKRYMVARNEWAARHILKRIRQGGIIPEAVLFKSSKEAYGRRSRMRPMQQDSYSVFEINYLAKKEPK